MSSPENPIEMQAMINLRAAQPGRITVAPDRGTLLGGLWPA